MLITAWFIVRFDLERQHFHHRRSEGWKANGEVKRIGSRKISQQSTENQSTKRWLPFCLVCGCEAKLNCKFKHFHFACGIIDPSVQQPHPFWATWNLVIIIIFTELRVKYNSVCVSPQPTFRKVASSWSTTWKRTRRPTKLLNGAPSRHYLF